MCIFIYVMYLIYLIRIPSFNTNTFYKFKCFL